MKRKKQLPRREAEQDPRNPDEVGARPRRKLRFRFMNDTFNLPSDLVRQTDICPDCIARDDVDLIGRPRRGRAGSIRVCMGCHGSARVRREKPDVISWYVSLRERES